MCGKNKITLTKIIKMNWILLILSGIIEVGFTTCLGKAKEAVGMTSLYWYLGFLLCMIGSFTLINKAMETIPLGTVYAVWTGIGAVGTVLVGIFVFKEPASAWRIFFIFLLISAIVGLKVTS